jgi:8-oxo-dGTP diphosphatase
LTIEATLCAILDDGRVLLQKKSSGRFGEGKWNGAGGKLRPGEDPTEGVTREVKEETGLTIEDPRHHGVLDHYFGDKTTPAWSVHIFSAPKFEGTLVESDEGELRWFSLEEIPYEEMWEDDRHWLPLLLEGRDFDGDFYFDEDATELMEFNIEVR